MTASVAALLAANIALQSSGGDIPLWLGIILIACLGFMLWLFWKAISFYYF